HRVSPQKHEAPRIGFDNFLPRLEVPDLRAIVACGAKAAFVWAEGDAAHSVAVRIDGQDFLALIEVPNLDGSHWFIEVFIPGGEQPTVGAEGQGGYPAAVPRKGVEQLAGMGIPNPHLFFDVVAPGGK